MRKKWSVAVALAFLVALGGGILFACSETPTSVPVRTFERAQRMDVVCLQIFDPNTGIAIVPRAVTEAECDPVAPDVNGQFLTNQLFALVTQSTRGELAVVDLSAGALIDQSRSTPGINFVPIGALPTDVAVTPDGKMAFVASQEPNKAAIYGVLTSRVVGDAFGLPADPQGTPSVASWPVCTLPQNPGALTVMPRTRPAGSTLPPYDLVAVLPGDRRSTAKLVTLDPRPFLQGAAPRLANGKHDVASLTRKTLKPDGTVAMDKDGIAIVDPRDAWLLADSPVLEPGQLAPCPILAATELVGQDHLPSTLVNGNPWADGIPYGDAGAALACDHPPAVGSNCGLPACCGDAGAAAAGTCSDAPKADAGPPALDVGTLESPRLVALARDDRFVYIADANVPMVHVVDLGSDTPHELAPFVAQSTLDPSRLISVKDIAVSPPTRDFKRFLYAVDREEGSLLVYDVTDPTTADRHPMRRPHPELNPFQPPDRLTFSTPAVTVSFARHDFPLSSLNGVPTPSAKTGVLCNPNPNLTIDNAARDPGYFYRAGISDPGVVIGARRLRGIFGFATLANGLVVAIDVDDWDAPCRRPILLGDPTTYVTGTTRTDITVVPTSSLPTFQPDPGACVGSFDAACDLDPYHAPLAAESSVTNELFFPISAPHRLRSDPLRSSSTNGISQLPRITGTPTINDNGIAKPYIGAASANTPLIMPVNEIPLENELVSSLGITFSYEVPDVHLDQDFLLTYNGAVPGFDGISATMSTPDQYSTLTFTQAQGHFCLKGVEDLARGVERSSAIAAELRAHGAVVPDNYDRKIGDYLQLTEDLLASDDPYWALKDLDGDQACWNGVSDPGQRYDSCQRAFGAGGLSAGTEINTERDLPILEAYDDHFVVGRFYSATGDVSLRDAVGKDPTNATKLKQVRCCFHNQARFHVRTGGVWSLVGYTPGGASLGIGFLNHMTQDAAGRCVESCDPDKVLMNSRAAANPITGGSYAPGRDSILALRNPMLSFYMVNGFAGVKNPDTDTSYRFSTRGNFSPLFINIGGTSISVSPQSMRFIETLGQLAVVDGSQQGLVLIDLGNVAIARQPYF